MVINADFPRKNAYIRIPVLPDSCPCRYFVYYALTKQMIQL